MFRVNIVKQYSLDDVENWRKKLNNVRIYREARDLYVSGASWGCCDRFLAKKKEIFSIYYNCKNLILDFAWNKERRRFTMRFFFYLLFFCVFITCLLDLSFRSYYVHDDLYYILYMRTKKIRKKRLPISGKCIARLLDVQTIIGAIYSKIVHGTHRVIY